VQVRGEVLKVREAATDMRAAIDLAADTMLRAVNRHAEQRRRGRPHHSQDKHQNGHPVADVEQLGAEIAASGEPSGDMYAP
jgi:ribosome-associated translation inhibitor RaiA